MLSKSTHARHRRRAVISCLFGLVVFSIGVRAESRYEVVPLHPGYEFGTEKALILDTVAGHLWVRIESPSVGDRDGGRYIIYQGQVVPGREMGDIILQQRRPPEKEK